MKEISYQSLCKDKRPLKRTVRHIILNDKEVPYILKRRRCKAISMKIDCEGLTVNAPMKETIGWIETVLQEKANWVLKKLDEWERMESVCLVWNESAVFPLLGKPWKLAIKPAGEMKMIPVKIKTTEEKTQLELQLPSVAAAQEIEKTVMQWYYRHAQIYFSKRISIYSKKLGVPCPQLRLSQAKTQWGSCDIRGIVHLNWRLIQLSINLIDYVIAHELSHLIEMNHSSAFWKTVESICPDYLANRSELRKIR